MRQLEKYKTYLWLYYVNELNITIKKQRLLDWIKNTDILKAYATLENCGHPGLQILTNTGKDEHSHKYQNSCKRLCWLSFHISILPTFLSNRTPDFELDIWLLGIKILSSCSWSSRLTGEKILPEGCVCCVWLVKSILTASEHVPLSSFVLTVKCTTAGACLGCQLGPWSGITIWE